MNLSKSRYTLGVRCEKLLWLSCYKGYEEEDLGIDNVFQNGNKVGELARRLFGDYYLIPYSNNYQDMLDKTNELLSHKPNVICEASFSYDGNFCSVDILKNDVDGVSLYEVKSSTSIKDIYLDDVTYQTWVLKKLGIKVKKSFVVYVNGNYVRKKELDLQEYFLIKDVTDEIDLSIVEETVSNLKRIINRDMEPKNDLSISCIKPYNCPFFKYCTKHLLKPNVFDLGWRMSFDKKLSLYHSGIISYDDLYKYGELNEKVKAQIAFSLYNSPPKIKKENIKSLLDSFTYPLYFLDFESYQVAIPEIVGTKPYQQICFQYSLHYYLEKDGKLYHKEYLNDCYDDNPMYGLCQRLCEDVPMNACILVYNDSFEKTRLKEMADIFPKFREHLLNIRDHIIDLLPIFRNQDYYVKEMGGSSSIKLVLPALFPNDASLDYHNLEQVHKGDEASNAYLSLKNLSKEEENILRHNMLRYCELDTLAMVKIYEKLREVIK